MNCRAGFLLLAFFFVVFIIVIDFYGENTLLSSWNSVSDPRLWFVNATASENGDSVDPRAVATSGGLFGLATSWYAINPSDASSATNGLGSLGPTTSSSPSGTTGTTGPPRRELWVYMVGNLRGYHTPSGQANMQKFVEQLEVEQNVSTKIALHTWGTFEHFSQSWWGKMNPTANQDWMEAVKFLNSTDNLLADNMTWNVEDQREVLSAGLLRIPNVTSPPKELLIVCAAAYSFRQAHRLAVAASAATGRPMADNAVIFKTRPDVTLFKTFRVEEFEDYLTAHPFTVFTVAHRWYKSWTDNFVSDVLWITSKVCTDRIVQGDYTGWLTIQYNATPGFLNGGLPFPPEWAFRRFLLELGVEVIFLPPEFTFQIRDLRLPQSAVQVAQDLEPLDIRPENFTSRYPLRRR
eukprot:TRINITY_DN7770_c0_g1_i1.p1 TRINITY_DN7770_c0_g1~~TRINITY_DN7770_c0_g1_i1.p1  ORF type:complete len:407 (-),score=61.73 TRINITY_DN7770_c0_g1_i1:277-1497(-)